MIAVDFRVIVEFLNGKLKFCRLLCNHSERNDVVFYVFHLGFRSNIEIVFYDDYLMLCGTTNSSFEFDYDELSLNKLVDDIDSFFKDAFYYDDFDLLLFKKLDGWLAISDDYSSDFGDCKLVVFSAGFGRRIGSVVFSRSSLKVGDSEVWIGVDNKQFRGELTDGVEFLVGLVK